MRTKALASLLILCGSTAAVASVTAMPQDADTMTNNSALENKVDEPAPGPAPDTAPAPTQTQAPDTPAEPKAPEKPGEATPPQ